MEEIVREASDGSDEASVKALTKFMRHFGQECGDFALRVVPRGGIFLMGEITDECFEYLPTHTDFLDGFLDKGAATPLIDKIPIFIITRNIALDGAEAFALSKC